MSKLVDVNHQGLIYHRRNIAII